MNKWGKIFRDQGMDMSIAITGDHSTPVLYGKLFILKGNRGPYRPPSPVRDIQCRFDGQ